METVQFIGACIGYTVSAITLLTLIIKPIRTKLIGWMKGINETDETAESIHRIEEMQNQQSALLAQIAEGTQASLRNNILQLVDTCLAREYITTVDRMNLKDMYAAYHNLGGDTYATERCNLALDLPTKD